MYDEDATLFGLGALTLGGLTFDLGLLAVAVPAIAAAGLVAFRLLSGRWF